MPNPGPARVAFFESPKSRPRESPCSRARPGPPAGAGRHRPSRKSATYPRVQRTHLLPQGEAFCRPRSERVTATLEENRKFRQFTVVLTLDRILRPAERCLLIWVRGLSNPSKVVVTPADVGGSASGCTRSYKCLALNSRVAASPQRRRSPSGRWTPPQPVRCTRSIGSNGGVGAHPVDTRHDLHTPPTPTAPMP